MSLPVDPKEAITYGALGIFALEKIISVFFSEAKRLRAQVATLRTEQAKMKTTNAVIKERILHLNKDLDTLWVRWRRVNETPRDNDPRD